MLTAKDLLSSSELSIYETTPWPHNLSVLHSKLKAKLEEDPDYEVWVPLVYYKYALLMRKEGSKAHVPATGWFISNKARVQSFKYNEPRILLPGKLEEGYLNLVSVEGSAKDTIIVHRALACSFIPLPERLKDVHPQFLHVNHIDTIKHNNDMDNLEWETHSGNNLHAVRCGVVKSGKQSKFTIPVKGVIITGPFTGHEFIINGKADCIKYGFQQPNISACCAGKVKSHKSCSWSVATDVERLSLPVGLPEEIRKSLL